MRAAQDVGFCKHGLPVESGCYFCGTKTYTAAAAGLLDHRNPRASEARARPSDAGRRGGQATAAKKRRLHEPSREYSRDASVKDQASDLGRDTRALLALLKSLEGRKDAQKLARAIGHLRKALGLLLEE